jgi:hypothetical protein
MIKSGRRTQRCIESVEEICSAALVRDAANGPGFPSVPALLMATSADRARYRPVHKAAYFALVPNIREDELRLCAEAA